MTDIHARPSARKSRARRPARKLATRAAERRLPKMHWRWCKRGRSIVALLELRFGPTLPDDAAGMDAVKLLAQHYMRLHLDAERVTKANLRLWAPWLMEKAIAGIIKVAKKAKTPSAVQLGKDWRVTPDEVAAHGLETITAFSVTQEQDRNRQARRRRKAGAGKKRGRPSLGMSPAEKKARTNAQAAERMRRKRALRKNSHAPSHIRGMERDELSVTHPDPILLLAPIVDRRAPQARRRLVPDDPIEGEPAPMLARAALGASTRSTPAARHL